MPGSRATVERRTGALLVYLGSLPRWMPFVLVAAVLGIGVLAGDALGGLVGFACLGGLAALMGWLAYVSWPRLPTGARVVRLLATVAVAVAALSFLVR